MHSRTYSRLNTILTLTIRSQVSAASSRISFRANEEPFEYLSWNPRNVADTLSLTIPKKSVFIQHSISRHSAHLLLSSRATSHSEDPLSRTDYHVSRYGTRIKVPHLEVSGKQMWKTVKSVSEQAEARESAAPRTELLFWYRLTTTDWLNWWLTLRRLPAPWTTTRGSEADHHHPDQPSSSFSDRRANTGDPLSFSLPLPLTSDRAAVSFLIARKEAKYRLIG